MRLFSCVLALILMSVTVVYAEQNDPSMPEIEARAAILIERKSGRVLFEQNADELLPIASITKVMTALLTIEHCDLGDVVTASANASGVTGTSIYLGEGERLTIHQMLMGLMLRSGNDAAVALAEHVGGDVDSFSKMMNDRAALLGADAHFVNPHGLDAKEHVATARGMALIANEAMDYPIFRDLVSIKKAVIPWADNPYDRVLTNKNKLLTTFEGATGIKTGFTKKAGRCLIFSAQRGDMELLGVVLNCGQWFDAAARLMNWGFETYTLQTFLRMNQEVARIPVTDGMQRDVPVIAPMSLTAPVARGEDAQLISETERSLHAPVYEGTVVGRADVMVDDEVIASRLLLAGETVEARTFAGGLLRVIRHFNPVG